MAANDDLSPWEPNKVKTPKPNTGSPQGWKSGDTITFTVFHRPMGAPRMTQRDKWKKRDCVEAYHAFRDAIRRDAPPLPPVEIIQSLSWVAFFARSRGSKHHVNDLHRVKPDRDNIDKAILDALFEEDSGVAAGTIEKRWGLESKIIVKLVLCSTESNQKKETNPTE